jgi:predicted Zn-dependent protease with MMP-like domain
VIRRGEDQPIARWRVRPAADYRADMDRPEAAETAHGAVDFDVVIDDTIEALPSAFVEQLGSVAIVVEDEPSPDQLASVGAAGLFGLYQGVPRTRWGVDNVPIPSKITLFRGPLTRANPGPERLARAVEDTLLHEIAHHFGIDDDRLRALKSEHRHG